MKKFLSICFCFASFLYSNAQNKINDGINYFLPKTQIKIAVLVEKKSFTPGEYAPYANAFLKKNVKQNNSTSFRVIGIRTYLDAIPDSSKNFTLSLDKKHSIIKLELNKNNVLTAINSKGPKEEPFVEFTPSRPAKHLDPRDFMSQEMLTAGSKEKVAELLVQDIYDIRESRDLLSRGEADNMPKDGEQLKLMFEQLNIKEKALRELFEGRTICDTTETIINFTPEKGVNNSIVFRFSKHNGITNINDLSGEPCYAIIEDLNVIPKIETNLEEDKKQKDNIGLYVNLPGKIRVTLEGEPIKKSSYEFYAAQFGNVEIISGQLFTKKQTTHISLYPTTGNIEKFDIVPLE